MKRFLANLSLMCTLAIGAVSINACTSSGDDPSGELANPTGLEASEITDTGATLNWNAVDGAKTYAVTIGEQSFATDKASYSAAGLTSGKRYNWSVQAVDGERTSAKVNGPAFTTKAEIAETLIKPTELVTKSKTLEGATLAWKAVDGATGYEVTYRVKGETEWSAETETSVEPNITLTGLGSGTRYEWKVRSTRDAQTSVYSEVATFITERDPVTFNAAVKDGKNGFNSRNGNTFEFLLSVPLFTAAEADRDGVVMVVELIAGNETIDLSTDIPILDIPEGTYNVSTGFTGNVLRVGSGASVLGVMEDGKAVDAFEIVGGTFTVEGDHTDYTMSLDLILADDDALKAEYRGPLEIKNPMIPDFDLGTITGVNVEHYGTLYDDGVAVSDGWTVQLYSSTAYEDEVGNWHGNGTIIFTQINTPLGTTDRIPDGEYPIVYSYAPGTAFLGTDTGNGTWIYTRENDTLVSSAQILTGSITISTTEGGGYRFEILAVDNSVPYPLTYKVAAESE